MTDKERIKLMHDELKKVAEELREMKSHLYYFMLQKLQKKESKDE
tara:strand:+ start:1611 stop:1745 length:135 start_codon:yes stop_codon:yes gene_type:complete